MTETTTHRSDEPAAEQPSVLVVDDEERLADLYAGFLDDDYDVTVADGGEAALETVDASVDVVLLDRRMPDRCGDEVLEALRRRRLDCRVAMVTAVEPDVDIIEMPFDDYLVKPVSRDELRLTVERLLVIEAFDEVEYELSSLRVKRSVLETECSNVELQSSEEFASLEERMAELRAEVRELRERLGDDALDRRRLA